MRTGQDWQFQGRRALPSRYATPLLRTVALFLLCVASGVAIGNSHGAKAADTCFSLTLQADPSAGGSLQVIEGHAGACAPGHYLDGTTYIVQANANPGWRLVSMTGGDPIPGSPEYVIGLFSGNVTVQATFARELSHGVATPSDTVAQSSWRYYVIDVPEGVSGLEVAMTGTNDADLYTRRGQLPTFGEPGPTTNDCRPYTDNSSVETCSHPGAGAGTWYVGVNGFGASPAVVSITATIDACWEVSVSSNPPGMTPNISPGQNCPGGYQHGTTITVIPVASVDSPFTGWTGSANGESNPLQYTVVGGANIMALHAVEISEGNPLSNQYVPIGADRYFYLDATPLMNTVRFKADLGNGNGEVSFYGYPEFDNGDKVCEGGIDSQTPSAVCAIPLPPPGVRHWFILSGVEDTLVNVSVSHCVQVRALSNPELAGSVTFYLPLECADGYSTEDAFNATAVPEDGYVFAGWRPSEILNNPQEFPLAGVDVSITAEFAKTLTSGVAESIPLDMPQGRFYHLAVPLNTASVQVVTSGPITATLSYHDPFGSGCESPCSIEFPFDGQYWIYVERVVDGPVANVTVTVTPGAVCYAVGMTASPPSGGTVTVTPPSDPDCPAGKFKEGTAVTVEANANPGFGFARWAHGAYAPEISFPVEYDNTLTAYFGTPLTNGVPSMVPMPSGEQVYFYIDVLPGASSIAPTSVFSPGELYGYSVLWESGNPGDSCSWENYLDSASCASNYPAPGRWWLAAVLYSFSPAGEVTVSLTIGDNLICRAITIAAYPPEAPSRPAAILPSPNCEGGTYLQGTTIALDIPPGNPGYVPAFVESADGSFTPVAVIGGVDVSMDLEIKVHYATRILPGTTSDIVLPEIGTIAYFLDVPVGIGQVTVVATNVPGTALRVDGRTTTPPSSFSCGSFGSSDEKQCTVSLEAVTRWFIALDGTQQTPIDLTVTLAPEIAGTIDTVSPSVIYLGNSEPVQLSVHGFGFEPGDLVWFNGVALVTQFVSENLLTATIPVQMLGSSPQNYIIFVSPTEPLNLRDVALPSNSVNLLLTRPTSDVNCDGEQTATDALDLLRYLAGFEVSGYCFGDVNLDEKTDLADAIRLRAEIAELVARLPMPLLVL